MVRLGTALAACAKCAKVGRRSIVKMSTIDEQGSSVQILINSLLGALGYAEDTILRM